MSERLTDEELNAIEGQCDGLSMLILNPAAQRDVRSMIAELRARRQHDLTTADREALEFARRVVGASDALFNDRMTDPKIREHVKRCRAASSVLTRLLGEP